MTDYLITLPDGRIAHVPMPASLEFRRPLEDVQAKSATAKYITKWVATALEPVIKPRPPWKQIVRDAEGRIDHVLDHPADPPAAETAHKLGAEAAEQYVREVDWS